MDKGNISLYRHTTQWEKLDTIRLKNDTTYEYYKAISPGFSYFAIEAPTPKAVIGPEPTREPTIEPEKILPQEPSLYVIESERPFSDLAFEDQVITLVILLEVALIAYLLNEYYRRRRPEPMRMYYKYIPG